MPDTCELCGQTIQTGFHPGDIVEYERGLSRFLGVIFDPTTIKSFYPRPPGFVQFIRLSDGRLNDCDPEYLTVVHGYHHVNRVSLKHGSVGTQAAF